MCGRFVRHSSVNDIASYFGLGSVQTDLNPSFNIAPTQDIAAIVHSYKYETEALVSLKWGLLPSWAKDKSMLAKMINARAETVAEKPSFRKAFYKRRCLIVLNGFYEWRKLDGGKEPVYIHLKNQKLFTLAGIFEGWKSPEGEVLYGCSIITTQANPLLSSVHHRMPVILPKSEHQLWLDPHMQDIKILQSVLLSYPAEEMSYYSVSDKVIKAAYNSPQCIERKEIA